MAPVKRAATPETPPSMTVSSSESSKEAELADKIRKKRKEIEDLEAELAEEKARHLQESAKKKQKCCSHLTSPNRIKGEEFLLKRVWKMLKEMKELSAKELPAAIAIYSEMHEFLSDLTGPQLSLPIEEFSMEQVDTLDTLKDIIQADMRHLAHLRASLGSTGSFFPDRLAAMVRMVESEAD